MKIIIYLLIISTLVNANSFSKSKKKLLKIYKDNQYTFYCNNPYEIKKVNNRYKALIVQDKKYYSPRKPYTKKGKPNIRATRVEWEHVMPAHNFGKHLPCWREGGRKACKKDPLFRKMEADMINLVPAIGEVNGDRSNFKYAAREASRGMYGECKVEVDFKDRRAYVREEIRGDIARIYFYMSEKYGVRLSKKERKMFEAWDREDPISRWEIEEKKELII